MEFGALEVAFEAPKLLLAALEMALATELARISEMELELEPVMALEIAPSSRWVLSFQPWVSFAVADPLTWGGRLGPSSSRHFGLPKFGWSGWSEKMTGGLRGEALGRRWTPLRNAFCSYEINVTVLRSGTRVPKSLSQLRNTLRNGTFVAKSGLYHFASRFAAAKWGLLCCEVALVCQNRLRNCENSHRESQSVAE
uniref:Uncharacterized protein n=1 Tax=Vitis vinifera TaxID=29760 RepID=A5C455_VITVI|nr:hypothetical protein VITISV_019078 [Vitis vinifera]